MFSKILPSGPNKKMIYSRFLDLKKLSEFNLVISIDCLRPFSVRMKTQLSIDINKIASATRYLSIIQISKTIPMVFSIRLAHTNVLKSTVNVIFFHVLSFGFSL